MKRSRPNWLLRLFLAVSVGVHLVLLLHLSGVFRSEALSVIELAMTTAPPAARVIPRPRFRPPEPPPVTDATRPLPVTPRPMPAFQPPAPVPSTAPPSDNLVLPVGSVDTVAVPATGIAQWVPQVETAPEEVFASPETYLEMVKSRIEQHKDYPENAKARQIQGRVTVRFTITPDGSVTSPEVVRKARFDALNQAALDAVNNAAPFPRPPAHLFKGALKLTVIVVFELT